MRTKLAHTIAGAYFLGLTLFNPIHAATIVSSTFQNDTEGWRGVVLSASPWIPGTTYAVSCCGPGYIWEYGWDNFYFSAPSQFLGDESVALGGFISFDASLRTESGAVYKSGPDVILRGTTGALIYSFSSPLSGAWNNYSIPLSSSAGWRLNSPNGELADNDQIGAVLGDLQGLYIRSDFWSNVSDVRNEAVFLTNVQLSTADLPEPAPAMLLLPGCLLIIAARHRARP